MTISIIILHGPTATGKTEYAHKRSTSCRDLQLLSDFDMRMIIENIQIFADLKTNAVFVFATQDLKQRTTEDHIKKLKVLEESCVAMITYKKFEKKKRLKV